jgi:CheY-like chemotaxis protein
VAVGSLYYYQLEDIDIYGTHTMHGPICVDWDADGLPDDWEITHGLNPWVNDAELDYDGDGLSNFEEYERDLDPFNPDTDGDGILDGAEDGRLPVQEDNGSRSISRGVEVLASDETGMTLALNTSGFEAEVVPVGGAEYERLHIADYVHGYTSRVGAPQLPLKGILIDVPAGKAAQLAVLTSSAEPYSGYRIYPVPEAVLDTQDGMAAVGTVFVQDELAYSTDGFYPQDVALLGRNYVFRDQVKQQVIFYPMRFNPASGQLVLYRRIELRIDFVDARYAQLSPSVQMPWQPPQAASSVLSSVAVSFAAAPVLINPISPILSSLGAAVTSIWSPPGEAEDGVYKVLTDVEGIYRITKDYLDTNGVDTAAINLSQVRIYYLGEEITIEVFDQNSDDHFDAADYIRFYAVPVSSPYAKYSAQNVYWLALSGGSGAPLRMQSIDAAPSGGLLAADFADTARHEQDIVYWLKAPGADSIERWFFNTYVQGTEHAGDGLPKPFTIAVPDPLSAGTLTILMAGQTDTKHELNVAINGVEQRFSWEGISFYEATLDNVPLLAGNNTVTLQCLSSDGNDSIIVDWFEVAYQRDYVAADNTLKFAPDSGSRYLIDGFSDNTLFAYDISDPTDVAIIDNAVISGANPYRFEFEPATAGSTYLVLASETGKIPVGLIEDTAADLALNASGADYILITHRDLGWNQNGDQLAWLTDLITHREAQGLRVFVADIQDIYDEFSYGIKSPVALKDFLAYAYSNWTPPAPRYVLLVGDSTYDPKDLWLNLDTTAYLPTYLMFTDHKGETVTDQWFVTFSGEDAVADMHIGRLPAADAAQAAVMVSKILTYETTPNSKFSDPNAWEKNILLVADNQRSGAEYLYEADFATMNDDAAALLPAVMNPYPGYLGIHYASAAYLNDFITTTLNNEGALMVNFAGHGATQVWANEHILDTGDLAGFTNTAELPFFVSMSCETGFFAYPEVWFYPSLAEALLRSDSGAVAAFMPSGMTTTEGQYILNTAIFDAIFTKDIRTLGAAIADAKQTLLANGDAYFEQITNTFLLFGDPAMELKVPLPHIPQDVTVERQDSGVHIRWQAVLDCNKSPVSGYNVYRSLSAGGIYSKINSALITDTQYLDTGSVSISAQSFAGSAATSYFYGVTSVDSSGDESAQTLGASPALIGSSSGGGGGGSGGAGCFISTTTPPLAFNINFKTLIIIVSIIISFWLLQSVYKPSGKKNTAKKKLNPFNELKNVKTLLVDDDEFIRNSLELAFKTKGCFLQVAETAEEGLQAIKKQQFDIIISDLRLPGINGLDFLKLTAVTQPKAVKFLITAYRDDHIFSEAVRLGVNEFIEKPFAVKVLINLLALAIKRQTRKQTTAGI